MQSLQPLQDRLFGLKIKFPKQMWKCSLQVIYKCCAQKNRMKNIKYSRNETILKIGHYARPIAFAKSPP